MARRKGEVQLQQEIETQEEWEDMLSKEGLCVIDVYQPWCGLCQGMTSNFRKYRNDINDDLLRFFAAKSDSIDALEKYRGHCEPCFLFFAGGVLVSVVRGANAPLILRTITEQLAQEHKVLEGQAERKEIRDPVIVQLEAKEKKAHEEEEAAEEEAAKKEVSVVIIKPDAVQNGKKDEIIEEMISHGIEILCEEERHLTEEEAKDLYIHLQDEEYFDDLVKFMSSSPCCVLAITKGPTGENIIKEFRELIGPTQVEEAKEQAPESLRAKYGSDKYMNAVHGSDSSDTAARELAFFFPDFAAPVAEGKPKVQRTLALIRPDAYKANKDEILAKIREAGFKVAMQKEVHLDKQQAEEFYSEHRGQEYFEELTTRMSSGPLLALGLAREDAIAGWRQMLGPPSLDEAKEQAPDSLRAQFAVEDIPLNQLHGSDSEETAQKEIQYFFPMEQTVAVIKPDAYGTKDEIIEKIHDAGFRIAARKETTLSREIAEEFYADHKDKDYYNDLVEHMISGPTCFMVLSREGAVDGWRSIIGPTDPETAREQDADTIRGKHGSSILQNAVHGSSNTSHAQQSIQTIFGDLKFNADGTVKEEGEDEAIAEQQHVSYEPAPEFGGYKDEKKEDKQETEPQVTEEQQPAEPEQQQASQDKPAEQQAPSTEDQTPKEQEQPAESQQESGDQKPDDQKPTEEEKPAEPQQAEESKPEAAPEQGETKPEDTQAEEPKEEPKAEEPQQQEEAQKAEEPPAQEPKQEDQKDEEKKEEESPAEPAPAQAEEGEAKPETEQKADAS